LALKKKKSNRNSTKKDSSTTVTVPLLVQTNSPNPAKDAVLKFVYTAAQRFQIGYMDGMDPDTGHIVPLLVLIEANDDKRFDVRPIARLLTDAEDNKEWLVPDGRGNYCQLRADAETEEGPPDERESSEDGERTLRD
jgi:hypothetical protein